MNRRDPEVMEAEVTPTLPSTVGGSVDIQVTTARRFPRSIETFITRATKMATLTPDIAAACVYALPRGGKSIEGPSARFAEIVAHAWGNLRIQAGTTGSDEKFITARGESWDVESNVAIGFEVKRRITDSSGRTYNDDMIGVTGNAAASIALRNAVLKNVPASFWRPIYLECRKVIAGDVRTFASRLDDMIKAFGVMGVTEAQICQALGVPGKADITIEHVVTLRGIHNALKENETTIEEAFPDSGGIGAPRAAQRKSAQAAAASAATEPAKAEPATPAAETKAAPVSAPAASGLATTPAEPSGTIADIQDRPNGAVMVVLSSGFKASTKDAATISALKKLREDDRTIELVTRPSSDPAKWAPSIVEITPLRDPGEEG